MPITAADAQAAIDRANGQKLNDILAGSQGDEANRQAYNPTGKKLGHEYMHRGYVAKEGAQEVDSATGVRSTTTATTLQKNMRAKSRTMNRRASAELAAALLNSPIGQNELTAAINANDGAQHWLQNIAIDRAMYGLVANDPSADSKAIYGYEREGAGKFSGEVAKKIETGSVNFRVVQGVLFIMSVYPQTFQAEGNFDYGNLFTS